MKPSLVPSAHGRFVLQGYLIALAALWGGFILEQRYHWGWDSYYNFGWAVPVVAIVLLYLRWKDSPPPAPVTPRLRRLLVGGISLGLLLLLPLRLLNDVNVFWRVPFLLQSWLLVAISWASIALLGGRSWLRHYWFPIIFLLTMVPWPYRIEVQVIQGLTHFVTEAAVGLLNVLGYPAEVRGNTIVVGEHWLGVDQACSGIRSLQALSMVALWLGEYFRLYPVGRVVVVLGAVGLTAVFNLIRASGLTIATVHGGQEAYEKWHDPLGIVTFITSVVLLYFLCEWFGGHEKPRVARQDAFPAMARWQAPRRLAAVMTAFAILTPLGAESWFRWRESLTSPSAEWTLKLDHQDDRLDELEMPEQVRSVLNFNYGVRAGYEIGMSESMELYFYGYTGEDKMQSVSSYGHRPDICMTASGAREIGEERPLRVEIGADLVLDFRHFRFENNRRSEDSPIPIQVFWLVWEKRNMGIPPEQLDSLHYATQMRMLWAGRRDYERQVLLLAVNNTSSVTRARRIARQFLQEHIEVSGVPLDSAVAVVER